MTKEELPFTINDNQNKAVRLWKSEGVFLIMKSKSRVIYFNQTGGFSCVQSYVEGILLPCNIDYPLSQKDLSLESQLAKITLNIQKLTIKLAEQIDELFSRHLETKCVRVDKELLHNSMESWIHVVITEDEDCDFYGFNKGKGVLTWQNSD